MKNRLLGTTALLGAAALGAGALMINDAAAQRICPESSVTGTGNVSNALCNYAGVKVPFTLTINGDVNEILQSNFGGPRSSNRNGVQANQGGPGNKDYGMFQDAWLRFNADAAGEEGTHYGFRFNLIANSNIQPAVASKGQFGYNVVQNNTADHSPSQIDKDYFYVRNPRWGQIQAGASNSSITANFPYTFGPGGSGWGPPGPAMLTVGPDGGVETQALTDPTAFGIDASLGMQGADGYRTKATMGVRYISPNFFGSDEDHGVNFDIDFSPDGRGHNEGNFNTDSTGDNGNQDLGWSRPPTQQFIGLMNIVEMALTWDDLVGKDFEFAAGAAFLHGDSKGGGDPATDGFDCKPTTPGGSCTGVFGGVDPVGSLGVPGAVSSIGHTDAAHKANQDLTEVLWGASVTYGGNLTFGTSWSYSGKSLYPANSPAYDSFGVTHPTTPTWGMSYGVEYDWDRYQIGADYQYASGQGDAADYGSIRLEYLEFGGSVQILKALKVFTDFAIYDARNNHSDATIIGGGCGSGGANPFTGSASDNACRRNSTGAIAVIGTSLDF